MELIDTHVHLLDPEHFTYAWCADSPALQGAFRIEDYRAAAVAAGVRIRSMIFMEADVPVDQQAAETDFFSRLAEQDQGEPRLAAIVAAAWPESAEFPRQIASLARNPRVRGVRRVLHTMPSDLATTPGFAANLRRLPRHGLVFELCLRPHLLPAATELAALCPETTFVLDHCGAPDVAGNKLDPWRAELRRLAARSNVTCKFSGLASCCDPRRPLTAQVRPYFQHCLECFGPARLMWGSDWPLCNLTFDLAAWLRTTAELFAELNEPDRQAIAVRTAERIYRC